MSNTSARDAFAAIIAEQRVGLLTVQLGKKSYRLQILPEEVGLLDWGGLRELRITDVLTYEGVASEEDFQLAQQEAKQKRKPIEQVLQEFGLIEEDLLPAIESRLLIEAVYGLLAEGTDGDFADNDGTPPAEPQVIVEIAELLEFMTKVEEDMEAFAAQAEISDIIGLTAELNEIKEQHELIGFATTVGRLCNGRRDVETIVKDSRLPLHHVIRTLNGFFTAGVARKFAFNDVRQQAAEAETRGHYDDAYALYQAAHKLRTGDMEVLEKMAAIAELIEDKVGIAEANDLLAQRHVASHNEPQAVKCYERVIRFDPHHHDAHEYLFKHAVRQEMHGEMISVGRELIRIHNEHKEFDLAKQVAHRCLTIAPADIRLLDSLAKTHVTCDEKDEAVEVYEKIMKLHEKKGDEEEAMTLLMTLRRLAPEREDFQKRIEAAHAAERRRSIIKWSAIAAAPLLLISLVIFLMHRAGVARATADSQLMVTKYEQVAARQLDPSNPETLVVLRDLLTTLTGHRREYPDDELVNPLIDKLNRQIANVEEKILLAEQDASREAERLYEEAIETQIGPPVDLDRARTLLEEAAETVPASNSDLTETIQRALADLATRVEEAAERQIERTTEMIDAALQEGDLTRARDLLEVLAGYTGRHESARIAHRNLSETMERSESSIVGARLARARERLAGGFLEEAKSLFEALQPMTDNARVQEEVETQLQKIQKELAEATQLLAAGEQAIQTGDNGLAVGIMDRLYQNYGNTQLANKIRLPVEINGNLSTVDITNADGKVQSSVPLPYTVLLGLDDSTTIEISRKGFEAVTLELTPSFEAYIRYVELARSPAWTYDIDGSMAQRPIPHGKAVLLCSSKSSVHLVDTATGKPLWDKPHPLGGITGFGSEPVVAAGIVVVPTTTRKVVGISLESGEEAWEFPAGKAFRGSPAVDADGKTVYVGCDDGQIYALDASSGRQLRTGSVGAPICGKILYHGGRLYFGAEDDDLHALTASTLTAAWSFSTGSDVLTRPIVSEDLLIFASRDSTVYGIDLDGQERWAQPVRGAVIGDMALSSGVVFVGTVGVEGVVQGLRASDGNILVTTPVVGPIPGGVVVIDNRLIFGSEDRYLRSYEIAVPIKALWELEVAGRIATAPSVSRGMLIVGTAGNRVYAFEEE